MGGKRKRYAKNKSRKQSRGNIDSTGVSVDLEDSDNDVTLPSNLTRLRHVMNNDPGTQVDDDNNSGFLRTAVCCNCKRKDDSERMSLNGFKLHDYLKIEFVKEKGSCISTGRKASILRIDDVRGKNEVILCTECHQALYCNPSGFEGGDDEEENVGRNYCLYTWPSFIWKSLKNASAMQTDMLRMWSLIPREWRVWWLDSVHEYLGYNNITLDYPGCAVKEVSFLKQEVEDALTNLAWVKVRDVCDKCLFFPHVKCPWGCSEFLNHCNDLPLETLFVTKFENMRSTDKLMRSSNAFSFIKGVRHDFIDCNPYLFGYKPLWTFPCICFVKGM